MVKSKINHKTGSALLITLLIVAVLAVVAFGSGQIFVLDRVITTAFEDTQTAYYGAQAGIEEGMRQFLANRNIEGLIVTPQLAVGSIEKLEISYKTLNPNFGPLAKDETLELETANIASSNSSLTIRATWSAINSSTYLQVGRIDSTTDSFNQVVNLATQLNQEEVIPLQTTTVKVRIKALGNNISQLTVSAGTTKIDSLKTTISSTGKFGTAKRKLEAVIDRRTGTLIGIFDYALLSQQTIQ